MIACDLVRPRSERSARAPRRIALLSAFSICLALSAASPLAAASAPTVTTLALSANSVAQGTAVTLTASVTSGGNPVSTGIVNFYQVVNSSEQVLLATQPLAARSKKAVLKRVFNPGAVVLEACFIPTSAFSASTSSQQTLTVSGQNTTTTAITSSGSVGNYSLTADVGAFGLPPLGGDISFKDQSNGNAVVGTATLDSTSLLTTFLPTNSCSGGNCATSYNPYTIALADLDGDGIQDAAVADNSGSVDIFLGNGDGTFTAKETYSVGSALYALAIGDFNRDGIPDLAIVIYGTGEIGIRLGNGNGTFGAMTTYSVGSHPSSVAIGDFNRDGILDLAVADYSSSEVTILYGNGDGTFTAGPTFQTGTAPYAIAAADLTGNGFLEDLTVACSSSVTVALGRGDGTFSIEDVVEGGEAWGVTTGKFDESAPPQIVAATTSGIAIIVHDSGTYVLQQVIHNSVWSPYAIASADVNMDGHLDLVFTNVNSNTVTVLLGNGDGTFQSPLEYKTSVVPQSVAVADLNQDGRPDLAVVSADGSTAGHLQVYLGLQTESATATGVAVTGAAGQHNIFAEFAGNSDYGSSTSSTVSLTAVAPPGIAAAFSPAGISLNGTSTLTVTLTGPGGNPVTLTGVAFSDTLPAGLQVASPSALSTTCGGGSAAASGASISLTGVSLAAGTTCTLQVNVTAAAAGSYTDTTGTVISSNGGTGLSASAQLSVSPGATTITTHSAALTYHATGSQSVMLSATVTSSAGTVNEGSVTFTVLEGATPVGASVIGQVSDGAAQATYQLPAATPVGTYTIRASYSDAAGNFSSSSNSSQTLAVSQATPSVSWTPTASIRYGTSLAALLNATASFSGSSVPGTFTYTANSTPVTAVTVLAAGSYSLSATFVPTDAVDYAGVSSMATLSVTQVTLTITANNATRIYGAANPTFTGSVTGAVNGDSFTESFTTSATPASNVGTYAIVPGVTGANVANYSVVPTNGILTISPAALTLRANNATRAYGAANPTFTGSVTGALNGDTITESFTTSAAQNSPIGTYPIVPGVTGAKVANYNVVPTNGVLTITPAALAIMANNATRAYGAANPTFTGSITGAVNGDSFTESFTTSATQNSPIGTYPIVPSVTGPSLGNYTVSPTNGTLTIAAAALTATANNATRVYGTANPAFAGSVTGAVNGDTFTESFATSATQTSNAGTYAIVPSVTGADVSDYAVTYKNGTLTVSQASTTVSLAASAASVNPGQSVTLSAQVQSSTTGTPTGNVIFYDGTTPMATVPLSGGAAVYTTTSLLPGVANTLTASYSGDTNFLAASTASSISVSVAALDFSLSVTGQTSVTINPGETATYQFVVDPSFSAYANSVSFTATGVPAGYSAIFSPASLAANAGKQTVTLTIQSQPSAALRPRSDSPLGPWPLLALIFLPWAGTRKRARRLVSALLLAVLPAVFFLSGCGSRIVPKTYPITITATAGPLQHTTTVVLVIDYRS